MGKPRSTHGISPNIFLFTCLCIYSVLEVQIASAALTIQQYAASVRQPHPTKSIKLNDGSTVDCVPREKQLGLSSKSPLVHPPASLKAAVKGTEQAASVNANDIFENWGKCPEGSVPIRRLTSSDIKKSGNVAKRMNKYHSDNVTVSSIDSGDTSAVGAAAVPVHHEYAYAGVSGGYLKNYGTQSVMSVNTPYVERKLYEFSLSQIWIIANRKGRTYLETIEAGFHNNYQINPDTKTRLFVYWTRDNYKSTGCYNLECSGYVQYSTTIYPTIKLKSNNVNSYAITLLVYKDDKNKVWWLVVGKTFVGYWPFRIFKQLNSYADNINWGGEIINSVPSGRHTKTDMGTGKFATQSPAAYHKSLKYVNKVGSTNYLYSLSSTKFFTASSRTGCYNTKKFSTGFYFGGPGYSAATCPGPFY